jgi:hypothetical protein
MAFVGVFLNVLVPVFALVALGYVAGPRLGLQTATLSKLTYFIVSPAFVFTLISSSRVQIDLAARMVAYIVAVYIATALIAYVLARLLRKPAAMTAAWVMITVFGNVGNFGLPISQFAQGREALVPATVYFLANLVLAFIVCVSAAKMTVGGSKLEALIGVAKTPSLVALVPALIVASLDIQVPLPLLRPLELLQGALIPIMLIVLGLQLANAGIPKINADMLAPVGIRLVGGAAISFALAGAFGLGGLERNVGILQGSMPGAVLVTLIAMENKMMPEFIGASILLSNVLSVFTLAVVLTLV